MTFLLADHIARRMIGYLRVICVTVTLYTVA